MTCVYCGDFASTKDHVPAQFYRHILSKSEYVFVLLPCCVSCNSWLGAKPLHTFRERQSAIVIDLEKRVKKIPPQDLEVIIKGTSGQLRNLLKKRLNKETSLRDRFNAAKYIQKEMENDADFGMARSLSLDLTKRVDGHEVS